MTGDWLKIVDPFDSSSKNSKSWEESDPGERRELKSDLDVPPDPTDDTLDCSRCLSPDPGRGRGAWQEAREGSWE